MFVAEVMEFVELTPLRDAIVGLPRVTGLSTEQRKRLSIAVELVANPYIIFMDEPTSRLDAHATAIVMRTVRNTVNTGSVGRHSHKHIEYFEVVAGVPKIIEGYNPATWALEVSSMATKERLGGDFAQILLKSKENRHSMNGIKLLLKS